MALPPLGILIVTYDRPVEIRKVITALTDRIIYPSELLHWHISDDGSETEYVPEIQRDFPTLHLTSTVTVRKGWGANVNKGLRYIFSHLKCNYVFSCEDDYVALRDANLADGVSLMEEQAAVGLVRYDGVSGHSLNLYLREVKLPAGRHMDYMILDKGSPHLNVYSHRPHLKHRRFHDKYGYYREGLSLGHTEVDFAHHVKNESDPGKPLIAILQDGIPRAFDHIGHTRQGTDKDRPT